MRAYFQWMECIARKQFVRFWTLELILIQTSNSFFCSTQSCAVLQQILAKDGYN